MNATEIWKQLCERHPGFKDDEYVLKQRAGGLRRLIEQAYENGVRDGLGRAVDSIDDRSAFETVFGKKFSK
jgi:hypothetical protein